MNTTADDEDVSSVCVLCGAPWPIFQNRCECGGFCTWGPAKGAQPSSWNEDGTPKSAPSAPSHEEREYVHPLTEAALEAEDARWATPSHEEKR